MPDAITKTFLANFESNYEHAIFSGYSIIVCNTSYCAVYTKTDSDSYVGSNRTQQQSGGGG
ncbi:hypothetical protein, partial [Xanthomonas sp. LMG 12460]